MTKTLWLFAVCYEEIEAARRGVTPPPSLRDAQIPNGPSLRAFARAEAYRHLGKPVPDDVLAAEVAACPKARAEIAAITIVDDPAWPDEAVAFVPRGVPPEPPEPPAAVPYRTPHTEPTVVSPAPEASIAAPPPPPARTWALSRAMVLAGWCYLLATFGTMLATRGSWEHGLLAGLVGMFVGTIMLA